VDAPIICGIMPIVSYRNALFMQNEMPGIHVDERVVSRYRPDMAREEAEQVAVEICLDIAGKLYDVADGFYLMTPFHRVGLVNRIIDGIRKNLAD
jgi:homocysteine S-methyltransferase